MLSYAEIERRLASSVWSERSNAILAALDGGHRQAIPILYRLLQSDPNPAVQQTAALALADFGERRAVPLLARMLAASKGDEADALLDALTRLSDPRGAHAVVPFLESSEPVMRLKAVEALKQMKATGQSARVLGMAQKNQDLEKAKTYAMALGHLKARQAEPYLMGLTRSSMPGPTLAASYLALGRIRSRAAVPLLVDAIEADFAKGRENAITALVAIGAAAAVPRAFPLLLSDSGDVRYGAAEVISSIDHPDTARRTLELLRAAARDPQKRRALGPAAEILGRRKVLAARQDIEKVLRERSMPERERLARALGWLRDRRSIPLLIEVLREKEGEGRYGAAFALGVLEAHEALDPLREAARSSDRKLAVLSVEALGGLQSSDSLAELIALIKKDASLAPFAIESITLLRGEGARQALLALARDSDGAYRRQAILGLGRRGEARSVADLIAILEQAPGPLHRSLFLALSRLSGQHFRTRNAWLNWHRRK